MTGQLRIIVATLLLMLGSTASAQLEKLVMPGRVIAGHAEIEGDCAACHNVQSDLPQATLCISCHIEVGEDRQTTSGFHGRYDTAQRNDCVVCHTDHEGRDADIVPVDAGIFDHGFTDFVLGGAHINASCGDCHTADAAYRDAASQCGSCHADDDVHGGSLGDTCDDCHNDTAWPRTTFDHSATSYPLTGQHQTTACIDCHRSNQFGGTPSDCSSCHAVDDVHAGENGQNCRNCHSTETWQQIGFDHSLETGFMLLDGHAGLACSDCHTRTDFKDGLDGNCNACHAGEDDHQGRNGSDCASCHSPVRWAETSFDHDETGFSLQDAHGELTCSACHKASTVAEVEKDCGSCHFLDDSHDEQLGNDCGSCHQQSSWLPAAGFDHDLSNYPLTGMHATAACGTCHQSGNFHDAPTDCATCHASDDIHRGGLGSDCNACHTSNDWTGSIFDHSAQTSFALDGAHANLECTTCHSNSEVGMSVIPSTCGGCHRSDDVHDNQFGARCNQCHDSISFSDVERL